MDAIDGEGDRLILVDGEALSDVEGDALALADGLEDTEGDELGEVDGLVEELVDGEVDGLAEVLAEGLAELLLDGLVDGELLTDGLELIDVDGEVLGLADTEALTELLGDDDGEADGDVAAACTTTSLGSVVVPDASAEPKVSESYPPLTHVGAELSMSLSKRAENFVIPVLLTAAIPDELRSKSYRFPVLIEAYVTPVASFVFDTFW